MQWNEKCGKNRIVVNLMQKMQTNINIAKKLHADNIHGRYIALEKWIIGLFECGEESNKIHKDEQISNVDAIYNDGIQQTKKQMKTSTMQYTR